MVCDQECSSFSATDVHWWGREWRSRRNGSKMRVIRNAEVWCQNARTAYKSWEKRSEAAPRAEPDDYAQNGPLVVTIQPFIHNRSHALLVPQKNTRVKSAFNKMIAARKLTRYGGQTSRKKTWSNKITFSDPGEVCYMHNLTDASKCSRSTTSVLSFVQHLWGLPWHASIENFLLTPGNTPYSPFNPCDQ